MGTGYTTIMYDTTSLEKGLADIGACQYDGAEIGLSKLLGAGSSNVEHWLDEYDLELYLVMSEWLESDETVSRVADRVETVAALDAEFLGLLPPQRGRHDDETIERWLGTVIDAAIASGIRPLLHHHGATCVEQPDEIRDWLDRFDELGLLWDTAHYYPYVEGYPSGDVTGGVDAFIDDIEYVHLKDVDPPSNFAEHREALSAGNFHLDNVINYFRSFTDLGDGVIDFDGVYEALTDAGYRGHITVEIENQTQNPLVHAKENYDYWQAVET